jgi:hypothetical protein
VLDEGEYLESDEDQSPAYDGQIRIHTWEPSAKVRACLVQEEGEQQEHPNSKGLCSDDLESCGCRDQLSNRPRRNQGGYGPAEVVLTSD